MKKWAIAAMAGALCFQAPGVHAAAYTDDLAKCLVKSTTEADQTELMVWLFGAMTVHPAVKPYSAMSDVQRNAKTKRAGELVQRLVIVDCRSETVAALKYEGSSAIEGAFRVLGEVAIRGLMADPQVAQEMAGLGKHFDAQKLGELATEAGLSTGVREAK